MRLLTRIRAWFKRWFCLLPEVEDAFCWRCGYAMDRVEGNCMRCAWGNVPEPGWEKYRDELYGP